MRIRTLLLAGTLALGAGSAQSNVITPVAISSNTAATDLSGSGQVINGSGLPSVNGDHAFGDFTLSWVTTDPGGLDSDYFDFGPTPVLVIDLGTDVMLDGMYVWNYSFGSFTGAPQANSISQFALRFATDSEGTAGFGNSIAYNPGFQMNRDNVPGNVNGLTSIAREDFGFSELVTARYIEMTIVDNFFGLTQPGTSEPFLGGDRVGFGELRFTGTPVPEPATFLFVALGVGGVGLRARRRSRH